MRIRFWHSAWNRWKHQIHQLTHWKSQPERIRPLFCWILLHGNEVDVARTRRFFLVFLWSSSPLIYTKWIHLGYNSQGRLTSMVATRRVWMATYVGKYLFWWQGDKNSTKRHIIMHVYIYIYIIHVYLYIWQTMFFLIFAHKFKSQ